MSNKKETIIKIKNLLLTDSDIHDLALFLSKEIRSIEPVFISDDVSLVKSPKYIYYGKLHSFDGVSTRLNNVVQTIVEGSLQLETIFDEVIVSNSHRWDFIGFKILLNN
jgi:hypothetical protein